MNNKTNIEEDIKILQDYSYSLATISSATEKDIRISKAIENMLANREQLQAKANKYDSLVKKVKRKLAKLQEEYELLLEHQSGKESNVSKYLKEQIHICQNLLEKLEGE